MRSHPTRRLPAMVSPRPATRLWLALTLALLATIVLLLALYTRLIPLGETGKFVYRYSNMLPARLARSLVLTPIIALLMASAWFLAKTDQSRRRLGIAIGALGMILLSAWTWWIPPGYLQQHAVNLLSPSHEGAFLIEATLAVPPYHGPSGYLQHFDADRLPKSVESMRGTRILSNTPGTTLLAYTLMQAWPSDVNNPGLFERYLLSVDTRPVDVPTVAYAMKFSVLLTALWTLSAFFAYPLGRLFLSPLGAGLFTLLVTFNPATANFVPGKDPAQLLTINAMLLAWFLGVRRNSSLFTAIAGALLMLGMAWGLVHLWVAMAALLATLWNSWRARQPMKTTLLRYFLSPALGAILFCAAVYFITGWNMPATFLAVARRYNEVQKWITYDRTLWFFIGLPLFLLFVSPALYALAALSRRFWYRPHSEGWRLLLSTLLIMIAVYFIGITYELPRLWVAFIPLLTLGVCADHPFLRSPHSRRSLGLILLLILANCLATALHVATLDARESEYRLSTTLFN